MRRRMMNSRDAFGVVVGYCENCGKTIYKHDTRYWVKLGKSELQMCKNCVVIEAEEDPLERKLNG